MPRSDDHPAHASPQRTMRGFVRPALALAATAVVLVLLVHRFGQGLGDALAGARPGWLTAAFVMANGAVLLGALRWQIVLESMHYRIGFGRSLVAVLATWPLAVVTPSRVNDLLRAWVVRRSVPLAAGTGSVLAEKMVDMSWLLGLAALGAALQSLWWWCSGISALLALELAFLALIVKHRGILARLPLSQDRARKVEGLFVAFDALFASPMRLVAACGVSLAIRSLTLGITFALLRAVNADVDLFDTCALWPVAVLVGLLPITLAGMGTRDATFIYLLAVRGHLVTHAAVLAATMGYSAIAVGFFAVIGLPFMLRESRAFEPG